MKNRTTGAPIYLNQTDLDRSLEIYFSSDNDSKYRFKAKQCDEFVKFPSSGVA